MSQVIRKLTAIVASLLLVVSCAAAKQHKIATPAAVPEAPTEFKPAKQQTYILHVDTNFSGMERQAILDGFAVWENITHGIVKFAVDETSSWDSDVDEIEVSEGTECTSDVFVVRMTSKAKIVKKIDNRGGGRTLAFTSSGCHKRLIAFVSDRLKDASMWRRVGVHEVGHLVGLDHIPVPNESIMFPTIDKSTACVSELDAKQFCMLWECDWREIDVCRR